MGTYVQTLVTITSDDIEFIERLYTTILPKPEPTGFAALKNKLFKKEPEPNVTLMEFLLPIPEHFDVTQFTERNGEVLEWKEWTTEHWGVPYDTYLELCERTSDTEIKLGFLSSRGNVSPGLTTAAKKHGFRFNMFFFYESGPVGHCTETKLDEFSFPEDGSPAELGMPKELIEAFDLNAYYAAYLEDN